MTINGVKFCPGEVTWENAYSSIREKLPDFGYLQAGTEYMGSKITTVGLVAKVGRYVVIITEHNEENGEYDYTVIPMRPKTKIVYQKK